MAVWVISFVFYVVIAWAMGRVHSIADMDLGLLAASMTTMGYMFYRKDRS
ncbi:MAG: hypothetical protein Q4P78_04925 [Rothia sp. (in: high G+C Gram-positive bacteria)]|nr:hypothetical protein [Rothia sp. (in: high G+C Gram-positive bacteria)]MDO5750530.1 hypothetical protein [Rothia sp. (in: high G+C Gram-positive bacteria)]